MVYFHLIAIEAVLMGSYSLCFFSMILFKIFTSLMRLEVKYLYYLSCLSAQEINVKLSVIRTLGSVKSE